MSDTALPGLITFLEHISADVKRIEADGEDALAQGGQTAFQACLEKKAKLLAGLAENSWVLVERLSKNEADGVARRLEQFSMSASTALRLGSVFFMTALLYPEDHKPGEPNDLDAFIGELRERAKG
ncbi:hypothetical protein BerOc1_00279 [Pseudodesulfovibrio hydrargyri]|uniref:Uncharacterized protein n=1 Tax=Pseudodesulfovibrio hydrargyri TaxID=2125990 RepID=A0A1J5NJH4_9BACT|nr:hypothetical protein [Pseudodesulfovibrio hydrargyri]OIQ51817.1 hypothetical protein BerOc1_00279 [Pseudodesulfovibrio hydrargyri]